MAHDTKTEIRNYLLAAGDDSIGMNSGSEGALREVDTAKNKLDQVIWKARELFKFFRETCHIEGLDMPREAVVNQIAEVNQALADAQAAVSNLAWPGLDGYWPENIATYSGLTDYVEEPAEDPAAPVDDAPAADADPGAEEPVAAE